MAGLIRDLNGGGTTILLVEQNVRLGLGLATHGIVMESGRVPLAGTAAQVRDHPHMAALYLGGPAPGPAEPGGAGPAWCSRWRPTARPATDSRRRASRRRSSALRDIGAPALPALLPLLETEGRAQQAARLLADIGQPDAGVIEALGGALTRFGANSGWVASALSRLGRLDLVLDHTPRLPEETLVAAAAAPFTGLRDQAVAPPRLDYRPPEDFIAGHPGSVAALEKELRPGRGCCAVTADEVDEAIRGLGSPHRVIRWHATRVLGERGLGPAGARTLPLLAGLVEHDPDPTVRRLAILSLTRWRHEWRRYRDVIRRACEDPVPEVRATATRWLDEQDAGEPA